MSAPRLKTEIWVHAHLRRCMGEGAYALIARRGDPDAGAVAVKVYLGQRQAHLFVQSRDLDGNSIWRDPLAPDDQDQHAHGESEIDAWLEKEISIDPDLWIIEIEDKNGRAFLDDI